MEGPMNNTENDTESFEQFRERIKQLIDNGSLGEQVQAEFDRWYKRRFEETDMRGVTISKKVKFQMELAHTYITMYKPDELIDETLSFALLQAQEGKDGQERLLKLITESPEQFIEWYLKTNEITAAMNPNEKEKFIAEKTIAIKSEIETLTSLIQIMLPE